MKGEANVTTPAGDLAREQAHVDRCYGIVDRDYAAYRERQRSIAARPGSGSPQNRSERDLMAAHYGDQAQRLASVEERLVFGRLDMDDAEVRHIGRIGLSEDGKPVLIDWRAPAAQPFYQATAPHPQGVVRRRHLYVRNRVVESIEDDVFDTERARENALTLQGEGALMAALSQGRKGHMGDIIATIQAEQDDIIRSDVSGALVVQGGPGTGKTAVALHRAAYLLYAHAERLARSGVLVVGPSPVFLRYIEQVLPALGETGVVSTTLGTLVPGIVATAHDSDAVTALKGDMRWVDILRDATRSLERVPSAPIRFCLDGISFSLLPEQVARARRSARQSHRTHNGGRETFVRAILADLTDAYIDAAAEQGVKYSDSDRGWIREEIRTHRDVRREVNLCWMPYAPHVFLNRLLSHPALLSRIARSRLSEEEIALLTRPADAPLTPADIVLIDELTESLGDFVDPRVQAARDAMAAQRKREMAMASDVLDNAGMTPGLVSADELVARASEGVRGIALAERAAADRTWTYGHIVVDEAQELSPLAWNALLRRCPSRSLTIVGDLAQRHGAGASTWRQALGPAARALASVETLTVCYRTPATIIEAAEACVAWAGQPAPEPTRAVRDVPGCLTLTRGVITLQSVRRVVEAELAALDEELGSGEGRVAVIVPDDALASWTESSPWGVDPIRDRVVVLSAQLSKGLEFDTVVLLEPATLAQRSAGDLYVAMTRPTRYLRVLASGEVPPPLEKLAQDRQMPRSFSARSSSMAL